MRRCTPRDHWPRSSNGEFPEPSPTAEGSSSTSPSAASAAPTSTPISRGVRKPGDLRPRMERHRLGRRCGRARVDRGRARGRGRGAAVASAAPVAAVRPTAVRWRSCRCSGGRAGAAARRVRPADRRRRDRASRQDQACTDRRAGRAGRAVHRRLPCRAPQRPAPRRHRRRPGAGPIGLGRDAVGPGRRCRQVIVVEPNAERRSLARALGAHHAVVPGDDAEAVIAELTHGLGADIVYECVGAAVRRAVGRRSRATRWIDVSDRTRRGGRTDLARVPGWSRRSR